MSRMLDMATGASLGSLVACGAILFYPLTWVLTVIVVGLSTLGGLIGYFWQMYYRL